MPVSRFQRLAAAHAVVIVEGVGGWEVPLAANYRVSDLARDLGLPVILVAANRLGALNHILLTVDAIRAKGLTCAGIILNQLDDELDTAMITNKGVLEELTGVPLLDHLISQPGFSRRRTGPKPGGGTWEMLAEPLLQIPNTPQRASHWRASATPLARTILAL